MGRLPRGATWTRGLTRSDNDPGFWDRSAYSGNTTDTASTEISRKKSARVGLVPGTRRNRRYRPSNVPLRFTAGDIAIGTCDPRDVVGGTVGGWPERPNPPLIVYSPLSGRLAPFLDVGGAPVVSEHLCCPVGVGEWCPRRRFRDVGWIDAVAVAYRRPLGPRHDRLRSGGVSPRRGQVRR